VALAIYLDDGAPVFYMQDRTGFGGKRFRMYKFRTMIVNAPTLPATKVVTEDGHEINAWPDKEKDDPRITRVGRFLRKTSLDEIPQIFNVLWGDMSLVGPRPTTWDVSMYTLHQTERLTVAPGLTGLWQVSARESKNPDERLLWDLKYVEKMSFWLDIQILWRTVMQVVDKGGV
jgi:lipopolysaccharide/colanic/teichoic acid biosynthesis glycosyltransferase